MTAMINRPPLSGRLASSKVIAVLRASHVSALTRVCDVLVEEGILSLELTLTTPGLFDALSDLVTRYTNTADVGGDTHHQPGCRQARGRTSDCGLSRRLDADRTRCGLERRCNRGQDLSRGDSRRRLPETSTGPIP